MTKRVKKIEVMVLMTPDQLLSVWESHPNEFSFTRQLVTWDMRGRKRLDFRAQRLELDKETLRVIPEDDTVPAFRLDVK